MQQLEKYFTDLDETSSSSYHQLYCWARSNPGPIAQMILWVLHRSSECAVFSPYLPCLSRSHHPFLGGWGWICHGPLGGSRVNLYCNGSLQWVQWEQWVSLSLLTKIGLVSFSSAIVILIWTILLNWWKFAVVNFLKKVFFFQFCMHIRSCTLCTVGYSLQF